MIFLVLFHFFTLLTNPLFKAHPTVKSNAPATLPRQYTHTQTLYQSHVNAAGCQRCLPFHWLTADIRIPAVSPPHPSPAPHSHPSPGLWNCDRHAAAPMRTGDRLMPRCDSCGEVGGSMRSSDPPSSCGSSTDWPNWARKLQCGGDKSGSTSPSVRMGEGCCLWFCSLWRVFALSHGMRRSIPMDLDKHCHGIMHWKTRGCNKKVLES